MTDGKQLGRKKVCHLVTMLVMLGQHHCELLESFRKSGKVKAQCWAHMAHNLDAKWHNMVSPTRAPRRVSRGREFPAPVASRSLTPRPQP